MNTCRIEGCFTRAHKKGWCDKHYERWRVHGDPVHGEVDLPVLRSEWLPLAACAGHPHPDWWFVDVSPYVHQVGAKHGVELMAAKRICRGCPVRTECLRDNGHLEYGIYGGLDPRERKLARRLSA